MISFYKMQATGNDFIIINCMTEKFRYSFSNLSEFLCNRKLGVGADGVIFLFSSRKANFRMRIFNADGTEAEMCGNGIRCLAKYVFENGLIYDNKFSIETLAGIKKVELIIENKTVIGIKVEMGNPVFEYYKIPVIFPNVINKKLENIEVNVDDYTYELFVISMGNPHAVCFVDDINNVNIDRLGPIIENYKYFPNKTNVEFVQVIDSKKIKVLVWERGVGRTLSCGTGACASSVISYIKKSTNNELTVELEGGKLKTVYNDKENQIQLIGNAEKVFEGVIDI